MQTKTFFLALVATAVLSLSGCAVEAPKETASSPSAPTAPTLPVANLDASRALLSEDEALQPLNFVAIGATTTGGSVVGYKSTAFAVPVAAGQTLTVTFAPSNTNLYMNIQDVADQSGAAVYRGEFDATTEELQSGTNRRVATLRASRDTTYLIRPYQPRAMARRNERGEFTLTVDRR